MGARAPFRWRKIAWETPGVLARSVRDHEEIIKALEARDPEVIAAAMVRHMRSVQETTKAMMTKKAQE